MIIDTEYYIMTVAEIQIYNSPENVNDVTTTIVLRDGEEKDVLYISYNMADDYLRATDGVLNIEMVICPGKEFDSEYRYSRNDHFVTVSKMIDAIFRDYMNFYKTKPIKLKEGANLLHEFIFFVMDRSWRGSWANIF